MDLARVHALYTALADDRLSFGYSGLFHDEHTARLITLCEEYLEREGADKSTKGKLAFIMVEAYQNIVRHRTPLSPDLLHGKGRSVFFLRSRNDQHEVTAINPVASADVAGITANIERLGGMDLHQMKQVFLRGLQSEERTVRGGAGLGLIEMARRSGNPLRHGFADLDGTHVLFLLQILLGRNAQWIGDPDTGFALHDLMAEQDISVLYRGYLAAGEQEVVLRIIERDLDEDDARGDTRTRSFLAAMELIAAMHPAGEGPLVALGRASAPIPNGAVSLVIGMPLEAVRAGLLRATVAAVNSLDPQGRQRRYRDLLLGRGEATDTMELGLIDLAKCSATPLQLEEFLWQGMPFLVVQVTI